MQGTKEVATAAELQVTMVSELIEVVGMFA